MKQFERLLIDGGIEYNVNVDLSKKTWIKRGGKASYFVSPCNASQLKLVVSFLYQNGIPHLVIGSSSNIYILNTTDIPVVVTTLKCNKYAVKDGFVECECGVQVSKLAKQMVEYGIKGFEYLTKLPGTVGAAIYNNSSCKSNSISELLIDVDCVSPQGLRKMYVDDFHFDFRTSDLKRQRVKGTILKARLKITEGNREELKKQAANNEAERKRTLEGPAQNLGCTVHKPFCNGPMPPKYRIPVMIYSKLLSVFVKDELEQKKRNKSFLLTISGHYNLKPYISDYLILIFVWKDEKADKYFNEYLEFMREVYKTDKVEIEIF